jgi:23S rRNA (uridine2552-2'-O)-methyltransferase
MNKRWLQEHKKDPYYRQAKAQGYRSRAAYKLQQVHTKFGIFKKGMTVLDLGAAPGGWSQMALELVGDKGRVVGVDLDHIKPLEKGDAVFIRGDMTKDATKDRIREALGESKCDVVISDMSPNISGNYSMDQARSVHLATAALNVARELLKPGGTFLVKVFEGEDFQEYLEDLRKSFRMVKRHSPPSSRSSSSELYVLCKGFRPTPA